MRKNIILILGFLAVAFITSSCLKDNFGENWTSALKGKMYAQFMKPGFQASTIAPADTDQYIQIMVNIASDAKPSVQNTITIAIDQAAMEAYSTKQQAADTSIHWRYVLYPGVTIVTPQVIVPAGSRVAYFKVKMSRADTLQLSTKYMIPLTITAATNGIVIAQNMKTALITVPIANQWEGDYASTGRIHKLTAWDRTWSQSKHLSTVDATTVEFSLADVGFICDMKIDPVTNEVLSIFNTDPTSYPIVFNTLADNIDGQGGDSHYDPATKTFYLFYYYVGTASLDRVAHEVLVRK